jgi:hypothetical protein
VGLTAAGYARRNLAVPLERGAFFRLPAKLAARLAPPPGEGRRWAGASTGSCTVLLLLCQHEPQEASCRLVELEDEEGNA